MLGGHQRNGDAERVGQRGRPDVGAEQEPFARDKFQLWVVRPDALDATVFDDKLRRLRAFVDGVYPEKGWDYYRRVDLRYDGLAFGTKPEA